MSYLLFSVDTGLLEQGQIDIAPVDFSVTAERSKAIDFLPSLSDSYLQLFLNNPVDTLNWKAYTEPLTPNCWLGVLLFVLIAPPIIAAIMIYSKNLHNCMFTYLYIHLDMYYVLHFI